MSIRLPEEQKGLEHNQDPPPNKYVVLDCSNTSELQYKIAINRFKVPVVSCWKTDQWYSKIRFDATTCGVNLTKLVIHDKTMRTFVDDFHEIATRWSDVEQYALSCHPYDGSWSILEVPRKYEKSAIKEGAELVIKVVRVMKLKELVGEFYGRPFNGVMFK